MIWNNTHVFSNGTSWICFFVVRNIYETFQQYRHNANSMALGLQHCYFARCATDDRHLANVFSMVYFPLQLPLSRVDCWFSIYATTGRAVGWMLGCVFIIELDAELAGIYFHWYCAVYDMCHKQDTWWPLRRIMFYACFSLTLPSWWMITRMCWAQKMLVGYIMSRVSSFDYLFAIEGLHVFSWSIRV